MTAGVHVIFYFDQQLVGCQPVEGRHHWKVQLVDKRLEGVFTRGHCCSSLQQQPDTPVAVYVGIIRAKGPQQS